MQGMTRRERQVTDEAQITAILDAGKVLHLGLAVDNEPYVVPMNYGYTRENGKLVMYLHSAVRGKKLDPKYEGVASMIGLMLILALFVFVTYHDILRIVG